MAFIVILKGMVHPFTRFDFKFADHQVAAEYEDIDGVLHFSFKIKEQTEFSARLVQSPVDFFIEFEQIHYGEVPRFEGPSQSAFKGSGLPEACLGQIMRKHPELRFIIRSAIANEPALRLARRLARAQLYFFIL